MDLTIISVLILPIIGVLKGVQYKILKECKTFLDKDGLKFKTMKNTSLISAYISVLNCYRDIRILIRNNFKEEDTQDFGRFKDFKSSKIEDIKDLHREIEYLIDRSGGKPEEIFRSTNNWDYQFKESNKKLFEGFFHLYQIDTFRTKTKILDCAYWILLFVSIAFLLITIGLDTTKIMYDVFGIQIVNIMFINSIVSLVLMINILIGFVLVKKDLESAYNDATRYEI